jgi:ferric-dicitrate binding protein FerR (iron transport regulator)
LKGACTPQEELLLKEYQDKFMLNDRPWVTETMGDEAEIKNRLSKKLHASMQADAKEKLNVKRFKWRYASAAAAILIFISVAIYLIEPKAPIQQHQVAIKQTQPAKKEIVPGSNKAVLTLADGSKIILDNAKKGVLTKQGNTAITKSDDGLLVYNFKSNETSAQAANPLNTIAIPRGGKYQIVLPDGTKVWLNSSSTLTFPTLFTGTERLVQLTGEAYFEVAKNKDMPFKVHLPNNTEVRVLGTHFNIMAYNDENEIKTTLLEGSVKLSNNLDNVLLVPGQQGTVGRTPNATFKVQEVNIAEAVAWKDGNFMFVNEDIKSIMKKISRWYDVDINYKNDVSGRTFSGTVSQFKDVTEVLKLIQLTGAVRFKIEERRIIVMQ